jgi:hypothetical protein
MWLNHLASVALMILVALVAVNLVIVARIHVRGELKSPNEILDLARKGHALARTYFRNVWAIGLLALLVMVLRFDQ